jgi:putative glutamine amidotransferase
MRKIIGITSDFDCENKKYLIRKNYIDSLIYDDVDIIIIPPVYSCLKSYAKLIDGLVIIGGKCDTPPDTYKEEILFDSVYVNRHRTDFDMALITEFIPLNKPILGICAGMQMMNVVFGGSLYQDIESQLSGKLDHTDKKSLHKTNIIKNTILHSICQTEQIITNTSHHQAIKNIANGFVVNAVAEDGIIEGIENQNHKFCVGVQWHPEYLNTTFDKKIFDSFILSLKD